MTNKPQRGPGRPMEKRTLEPIPDTPDNIMRAVLATPPKRAGEWKYLQISDD